MPEIMYDTQDAVPEDVRDAAVAKDGKFAVSLVAKKSLDEFRENNIRVVKERDAFGNLIGRLTADVGFKNEKPEDIDAFVNEIKDLRSTAQQVADGKLVKDSSLDEAITKRTGEMQKQHQAQLQAVTTVKDNLQVQVNQLQEALNQTVIDREVGAAALNETSGLRPDALKGVLREAKDFFKVIDGRLIAKDHEGNTIYGSDGTSPMGPMEWIKTRLSADAPYYFKASTGGGSEGGRDLPGGMSREDFNKLPPQERIRIDRERRAQGGGR